MTSPDGIEPLLSAQLVEARGGNAGAAAVTAMLIHKYPQEAAKLGLSGEYEWLLSQVLHSRDAELVVCVAEDLLAGKRLAKDPARAVRFFARADDLSEFMGSYVLGLILARQERPEALKHLKRARLAGHIPSAVLEHHLLAKRLPLIGWLAKRLFALLDFIAAWRAIHSVQKQRRFWRYRDVFPDSNKSMAEQIGNDRGQPIPALAALTNGTSES